MTINERFRYVLDYFKSSPEEFASQIGKSGMAVRNVIGGKNNPSFEMIEGILNIYKEISSEWLLRGGDIKQMFISEEVVFIKEKLNSCESDKNELLKNLDRERQNLSIAHKLITQLEAKIKS